MAAPQHNSLALGRNLRARLLLLAASGLLPLVLVLAWGLNYLVNERRDEAERTALGLSRALAAAVNAELRSTLTLLEHIGTSDELERADFRLLHENLQRTAEQLGWMQIALSDAQGVVIMRTSEPFGRTLPVSIDPASIAQVIQTAQPAVSRVFTLNGQLDEAFAVRVPVLRSGELVYILSAVLPTELIRTVLVRQNIPATSVVSIYDQVNRSVARSRELLSPAPAPAMVQLLSGFEPQGRGQVVRDGTDYHVGFTRLPGSGWVVIVGNEVSETNKALYAVLGAGALGLAASLVLSALLAWVLSRRVVAPINTLEQAAAALGRGQPVVVPPLEVEELEGIAAALQDAAKDRDRAAAQVADALRVAKEANSSKDQFLAVLGHELRNPLAPIATAVQLMALKGDETTANERRIIQRQLSHVTRLVDDLLDVSRITSGRLVIRREPLRLVQVLGQLVETMGPSLQGRKLSLQVEPGADGAWVNGDEVRIAQVFNNLLVNAIKFTRPQGTIQVKASLVDSDVQVEVADDGVGLSPAELERVFELFYQTPQSADRAQGGLGLGLPIVRSLVALHGGAVYATSPGPGLGSSVTVRLPLCEAPVEAQDTAAPPSGEGGGRVMVVDDNEDAALTCASLLELSGYTVRVAYTPEAALELLREFTPEVAILDIGLPGMSGHELGRRMRAEPARYQGRLVAQTGYGQAADRAASREAGFDAHLTKPVKPEELVALVARLMQPSREPGDPVGAD
jgi:signal transduction histidine kinase/ActR/RegA family two-component response regulator